MHATGRQSSSKALSLIFFQAAHNKGRISAACLYTVLDLALQVYALNLNADTDFLDPYSTQPTLASSGNFMIFFLWLAHHFLLNLELAPRISVSHSVFQVAIHSVLEKLFRSIWSLPNSRAPFAIKYFFDFLDAQAENKKITDPDVVHIWKTNRWECRWLLTISQNLGQNVKYIVAVSESQGLNSILKDKITKFCYL